MLAGEAPAAAVAAHLSATVVALPKRAGGVRPVACGSVLRRLAARGACLALKEDIATAVGPHQFAVGVAGGCEKVQNGTPGAERQSRKTAKRTSARTLTKGLKKDGPKRPLRDP